MNGTALCLTKHFLIDPTVRMSTLNLQSVSLIHHSQRPSCSAKPKNPNFLQLGHGSIYAHPFVGNKGRQRYKCPALRAKKQSEESSVSPVEEDKEVAENKVNAEEKEYVEEEVEMSWIEEKAEDLVQFTSSVTEAIPGPRVAQSKLPWLLAVPLAYMGLTFVIAVVKTIRKLKSPREKKRKLVSKNAMLCKKLDDLLESKEDDVSYAELKQLMRKTGFSMDDILRKYIRYALSVKPFNPDLVENLIYLRRASRLEDGKVAEVLNEASRRIVKDKGPVVMNTAGFTEKGMQRKMAVQALFTKLLYLAELDEFCSTTQSALGIKEIFGVTDEDANALRIETLSEVLDVASLEEMVKSSSDLDSESEEADAK